MTTSLNGWDYSPSARVENQALHLDGGGYAARRVRWDDIELSVRGKRTGDAVLLIGYRVSEQGAYLLRIQADTLELQRRTGIGDPVSLASSPISAPTDQWVEVEIEARGNKQNILFNGQSTLSVVDPDPLGPGGIELRAEGSSPAEYDDFHVVSGPVTQPLVLLLSPATNVYQADIQSYAEGTQIDLAAVAQSEMGVARIEFRVDDMTVGQITSNSENGEPVLNGIVAWVATGKTGHLITAEAFRADGMSLGSSDVAIKVVDRPVALPSGSAINVDTLPVNAVPPTFTPSGGPVDVSATLTSQLTPTQAALPSPTTFTNPSGGPTALVNVATLNIRQGPGINYPAVGSFTQGQQVEIVGRNSESTWWAIPYRDGTAWIFGGLVVIQGDASQVPLVAAPPPPVIPTGAPSLTPAGPADLVIDSIRLDPATPQANVLFYVYAVVRNAGGTASPEADAMLTFQPGDEHSPADPRIPSLPPGGTKEIFFRVTLKGSGTGLTGVVDIDLYNAVAEGNGEANNRGSITYNVNP